MLRFELMPPVLIKFLFTTSLNVILKKNIYNISMLLTDISSTLFVYIYI